MSLPLIEGYELGGDILCADCIGLYKQSTDTRGKELVPLFSSELKPTDQCVVCKRFLMKEPIDV